MSDNKIKGSINNNVDNNVNISMNKESDSNRTAFCRYGIHSEYIEEVVASIKDYLLRQPVE